MSDELHGGAPLTDVSVAYQGAARSFLADQIFPAVPVGPSGADYRNPRPPAPRPVPPVEDYPIGDIEFALHDMDPALLGQRDDREEPVELRVEWDDEFALDRTRVEDGRHRIVAAFLAGRKSVRARVHR